MTASRRGPGSALLLTALCGLALGQASSAWATDGPPGTASNAASRSSTAVRASRVRARSARALRMGRRWRPAGGRALGSPRPPALGTTADDEPTQRNYEVTRAYETIAPALQRVVEQSAGADPSRAKTFPNWYALGAHASDTAGHVIAMSALGLTALGEPGAGGPAAAKALRTSQRTHPFLRALARMRAQSRASGRTSGVVSDLAALVAMASIMNPGILREPAALRVTAGRARRIYASAPGRRPRDKVRAVLKTTLQMFQEGNDAIHQDIGHAGEAYLAFHESAGPHAPTDVLDRFELEGATPQGARTAYAIARASRSTSELVRLLQRAFPTAATSRSVLVAAFALYEEAGRESDVGARNRLVKSANDLVIFREQRDAVAAAFEPEAPQPGEVDRPGLIELFTPMLRVRFGQTRWDFSDYGKRLTRLARRPSRKWAERTRRDWVEFPRRWPAMMDAINKAYGHPAEIWRLPVLPPPN